MNSSSETYLTVRLHADALAHDAYHSSWRKHRNEPLDQLFHAIWLDQFEDETTHCLLLRPDDLKDHKRGIRRRPEQSSIRVMLWRMLPKGEYWIPDPIRKAHEGEYLWKEMAALPWDDYDEVWRRSNIEQVLIAAHTFEDWKAKYGPSRQPKEPPQLSDEDLLRENMIKKVLAKAKRKWPKGTPNPGIRQMARLLASEKTLGFGEESVRKILDGTYKPMKRLGLESPFRPGTNTQ